MSLKVPVLKSVLSLKIISRANSFVVFILFFANIPWSKAKVFSEMDVKKILLSKTLQYREIESKYQQLELAPFKVKGDYEWKVLLETGVEQDRTETLTSVGNYSFSRFKTTSSLNRNFTSGTSALFEWSYTDQQRNGDVNSVLATGNRYYYHLLGLTIEQNILSNSLGGADRLRIASSESLLKSNEFQKKQDIQTYLLSGMKLYWNMFVLWTDYKNTLDSKNRYEKLVKSIKKKNSIGYTSPGELSQVLAEFESKSFQLKSVEQQLELQKKNFLTYLNLSTSIGDIEFETLEKIEKTKIEIPIDEKYSLEETHSINSQKLKIKSTQEDFESTQLKNKPQLNLVARLYASGVDENSGSSVNEAVSFSRPKSYIGIKFSHSFGSDFQAKEVLTKLGAVELEKIRLQRLKDDLSDYKNTILSQIKLQEELLESLKVQKKLREKSVSEITLAHQQGRTDIRNLIEALNSYANVESQYYKAFADFKIAYLEWQALQGTL